MSVAICIIIGIILSVCVIRLKVVLPIFDIIENAYSNLTGLSYYMCRRLLWGEEYHRYEYNKEREEYEIIRNAVARINEVETRISQKFMTPHEKKEYSKFLGRLKPAEDSMNASLKKLKEFESIQSP